MVSLQCDVHLLTAREDLQVRDTDFSCFKYHDKAVLKTQAERPYAIDKTSFAVGRGQKWYLENKRPERLRTNLKELEDLLGEHSVIFCKWRSSHMFQLVLATGMIINVHLNKLGDLSRISFDKYLVGRLSDHITDLVFTSRVIVVTYLDSKLTLISFGREVNFVSCESLVSCDPKLHHVELHCPPGRRLDRRIVLDSESQQVLVWWNTGGQEVFPWSPELREEDRANLALLTVRPEPRLLGYHRTSNDPIYLRFLSDSNTIHCLSQVQQTTRRGDTELENTILSIDHDKHIRKRASRWLKVNNCVVCHALIPQSDNVLLGTIDGTIITFDQVENKIDNQVRAGFIPHQLLCHPDGAVFMAVSEKGLVQCFDIALSPVQLCFPNEEQVTGSLLDLGLYFRQPVMVRGGSWSCGGQDRPHDSVMDYSLLLLRLQAGPLTLLRLNSGVYTRGKIGPLQIVGQYLKYNLYHQVLLFLSQLSWLYCGQTVLMCLTTAFNAFLKLPFTREKECLLEMCLGLFHAPAKPLSEEVREEYSDNIRDLTRRFFHYLVRHHQLVKGFQLAVDINDYDLYLDIHHAAVRRNVPDLAHAALIKARAAYSAVESEGGSRCNSSQSIPTPIHMFTTADNFLHPVKSATFLKTTSAKKINTHEFKSGEFDEVAGLGLPTGAGRSLKYESIVTLPQPELAATPGPVMTTFQPSPYVYRHRQDDRFITHLNTEDFVSSKARQGAGQGAGQEVGLVTSQVRELTVSDQASLQPRHREQAAGKEDIKVIHFGVV